MLQNINAKTKAYGRRREKPQTFPPDCILICHREKKDRKKPGSTAFLPQIWNGLFHTRDSFRFLSRYCQSIEDSYDICVLSYIDDRLPFMVDRSSWIDTRFTILDSRLMLRVQLRADDPTT